jgi:2-keto-3-deoxy-6-phosphogluconate aldolase
MNTPIQQDNPTVECAKKAASQVACVFPEEIFGPSTRKHIADARSIAVRLMAMRGMKQSEIARYTGRTIGNTGHTLRRSDKRMRNDEAYRSQLLNTRLVFDGLIAKEGPQ